ncbi:MAG: hypothetical protein ACFFD1_05130, partial [Candidatus Thorarchaeota archaeon]
GLLAIVLGILLIILSIFGPLIFGIIKYKTSSSSIYQIQGQDLVNLLIISPICIIGGIMQILNNKTAKYFLASVPIYISFYTGLAYGIGAEWSHPAYNGEYNSNQYFWLFLILIFGGLFLAFYSVSQFSEIDVPHFSKKSIRIFSLVWLIFICMFFLLWLSEILQVNLTGDTLNGSYLEAPTSFWTVKYLDLGITLPLGFLSLYLFNTRPKRAYPYLLLFFSFFVILTLAVNMMMLVMIINHDPLVQPEGMIIFPILFILSFSGYFYLIKEKILH